MAPDALLKPDWLRVKAPQRERIGAVADLLVDLKLNTVCQEASCPNIGECFAGGTATFLIMGPGCTRACPYCDIDFDKSVQGPRSQRTGAAGRGGGPHGSLPCGDHLGEP